jgi:TonB family protein
MAFGVSVTTHLASAAVVLLAVFAQPSSAPIVREVSRVFMAPASVAPPAFQPRTMPLIKTPPIRASRQAAPVEAPVSMPTVDPPIAPPQPPLSDLSPLGLPTPVDTAAIIQSVPGRGIEEEVDGRISEQPVQDVDRVARVVTKVAPKGIPADALTRVLIEVTIDSTGRVRNARVLDSTPYAAQVLEAVRAWVFSPAVKRGRPVVSSLKLQIDLNPK